MLKNIFLFFLLLLSFSSWTQTIKYVYFDFDKYELTPAAKITLHNIINDNRIIKIDIKGYTDSVGNFTYNKHLSYNRAKTVQQYLQQKFSNATLLPLGETINEPTDALNRRVEISISYEDDTKIGVGANTVDSIPIKIAVDNVTVAQKIAFDKIYFEPNLAVFKPTAYKQLEELHKKVLQLNGKKIEIRGHVNWPKSFGSFENDNEFKNLSLNRAKAVVNFLISKGVDVKNISIRGMDNTEMIYPYATQRFQMEQNMRVEVVLLNDE
jgi:outer membrane protein OmpA-like peptidoglycan-associated protein